MDADSAACEKWYLVPSNTNRPLIPIGEGVTNVGRFRSPGLDKDDVHISRVHMVFQLTVDAEGKHKCSVEFSGSNSLCSVVNGKRLRKNGGSLPVKPGDKINLLDIKSTLDSGGGKSARDKYLYTVKVIDDEEAPVETSPPAQAVSNAKRKREEGKKREVVEMDFTLSDDDEEEEPLAVDTPEEIDKGKGKGKAGASSQNDGSDEWAQIAEEFTCAMCQDLIVDAVSLDCGHQFCTSCVEDWTKGNNRAKLCPTCRNDITVMVPCLQIDASIDRMVSAGKVPADDAEEYTRRREAARLARNGKPRKMVHLAAAAAMPPPPPAPMSRAVPVGLSTQQRRRIQQSLAQAHAQVAAQQLRQAQIRAEAQRAQQLAEARRKEARERAIRSLIPQGGGGSATPFIDLT